jgi:phosphatidylglycerol---prolipoprotein diacylglyceryl transferase
MINPIAFQVFGHDIRWYGIIIAIGLLLGILLAMYHAKREGQDPDSILDLALIVVPMAVIFARIYYVVFQWNQIYANLPFWHVFAIWEGGLAIYGAVIGGLLGAWIYARFVNKKIKLAPLLDILAPSLILGQAIGRWGNFVNQEAYGRVITNPSWQWFPAAVYITNPQIQGQQTGWYMATFFYESIWNFIVFAFLYFYFKNNKNRKAGNVFWFYLLLYGFGRLIIEGLRTDSLYLAGDIRISQWLSGVIMVVAVCGLFWDKLSPVVMPVLRPIGNAFKKLGQIIKNFFVNIGMAVNKFFADMQARREAEEEVPLDESLRLRVELPEEEETPVESEKPAETAEGAKALPEEKKDEKD